MLLTGLLAAGCATQPAALSTDEARQQVTETELAFARSMANRDLAAFATFIADDAVFLDGNDALRGRAAVVNGWSRLFEGTEPPFSWAPDRVEIASGGRLGYSSGPVTRANGQRAGRFNSVWQRHADGRWQIVFDAGSD